MEASLTIKVTYGGITRRFHEDVDENRNLNLDMIGLKARIFSLFDIPTDSDVSITYVDDGNDVVHLVDDVDLQEVMVQKLECLKITVLNNERIDCLYSAACRSSTPQKHQTLPDLSVVAESHATMVMRPPVFDKAGSVGGYSVGSAVISQPVLAGSNNMEEDNARDASNKLAFGVSSSISKKGIEAGVKYLPAAAAVNSHSNANADTPRKSGLSEEVRDLLRQLQEENDDLNNKMEQILRQIIEGKEVDIGHAPKAPIIDSSREPRLAEDNSEAKLHGEINALKSKRELLLEQNKILKKIESNKPQLLKEIEALRNENEQLLQQSKNAEGSYGGQPDDELVLNEPRGEEEDGSQKMIMPPLNVSGILKWIQAEVPSLGDLLTNLSIPGWLKTTIRWLLTLIFRLPWRRIFDLAYSFISFVRNSISSTYQWLREKLYDVMADLTRKMAQSSRRPQVRYM